MTVRRREPAQGVQSGSHNRQENYFAPVTQYVFSGGFERLRDVCFDPAPPARDLDLARFTGRAGDRDIIVSGSDDRTVLVRQHRPRGQRA